MIHKICGIPSGYFIISILSLPYHASLLGARGFHLCSGALIDENWVLTSARCAQYNELPKIRLGEHNYVASTETEQV